MDNTIQILHETILDLLEESFPSGQVPHALTNKVAWQGERAAYAMEHIMWIAEQLSTIYGREFVHFNVRGVIVDNLLRQLIVECLFLMKDEERSIHDLINSIFTELTPVLIFDSEEGNRFYIDQLAGQFVSRLQDYPAGDQLAVELIKDAVRLLHLDFVHPE